MQSSGWRAGSQHFPNPETELRCCCCCCCHSAKHPCAEIHPEHTACELKRETLQNQSAVALPEKRLLISSLVRKPQPFSALKSLILAPVQRLTSKSKH